MSRRTGRGSTGQGRPSALPGADFQAPPLVRHTMPGGLVVDFRGEDARQHTYDFSRLPMSGWHALLAEAFALRTGHEGGARTLASAKGAWETIGRWTRWLETLEHPPTCPAECTRAHVDAFHTRSDVSVFTRWTDQREMRTLVIKDQVRFQLPTTTWDALNRRICRPSSEGQGGYSDGEWARLVAAARADTARIARRVRAGEDLLRRFREDPAALSELERARGRALSHLADTGEVLPDPGTPGPGSRGALAAQLGLRWSDLAPLLVLMAAVSERNGETVKELPAKHRLLEDRAVEVVVVKRRRGNNKWTETVAWEIGPPGRALHTPGGVYLLLLELTARSRAFCGSSAALCFWRDGKRAKVTGAAEHYAPFEINLSGGGQLGLTAWAAGRRKPVLADPEQATKKEPKSCDDTAAEAVEEPVQKPLSVAFNRIKTSADVRRTKRMGGHLPSSAKSNTAQVLFTHYLRPDATTREWAEGVMQEALEEAEQSALQAHEEAALRAHEKAKQARGGGPRVIPGPTSPAALEEAGLPPDTAATLNGGALDTAWTACGDFDHNPVTDLPCSDSFLDCFHCGNCLVTRDHLPYLLALLDALVTRYQQMDQEHWWQRYGPAWAAVRRDILAKFDPAEVAEARTKPLPLSDALLDLVEAPWEQP